MSRETIWCDHCNAPIPINGILSCLRKTCVTKDKVPPGKRKYHQ